MARLKVMRAQAGRMVRGRFVPGKRKNIAQGFHDTGGVFHPIRASSDYDPSRAGEGRSKKKKAARKPAGKKKAAPKRKKPAAKKKPAKRKRAKR